MIGHWSLVELGAMLLSLSTMVTVSQYNKSASLNIAIVRIYFIRLKIIEMIVNDVIAFFFFFTCFYIAFVFYIVCNIIMLKFWIRLISQILHIHFL